MNICCNQCGADITFEDPDTRYLIETDRYCFDCFTANPEKYLSRDDDDE